MRRSIAFLVVFAWAAPLAAEVGPPVDLSTRARGAAKVVVARVVDVTAAFTTNGFGDQLIVSDVALAVEETLKGVSGSSLSLDVEGGTVGDITLRVSDMPSVSAGERAVFFLDETTGRHVPHRRGLGILKLDNADRVQGSTLTLADVKRIVLASSGRGGR